MYKICAIAIDNKAIRLFGEPLFETFVGFAIDTLVAQSQPLERYVGSKYAHLSPRTIVNVSSVSSS